MGNSEKIRPRRGRPARYTREHVIRVALVLLEQDASKPLTLRALADELGITPMAIYGYVSDLDDVLQEAARTALDEIRAEADLSGPWHEQIRAAVFDIFRLGKKYPNLDDSVNLREGLSLDSVDVVSIVSQIERRFHTRLTHQELEKLVTVSDVLDLLETKLTAVR